MTAKDFDLFTKPLSRINIRTAVKEAAMQHRQDVVDLQQEQMEKGLEATGQPITPPYTRNTVAIKKTKGQPADRVTLKDTGAFHRSIRAAYDRDHLRVSSRNSKTADLVAKYGDDIFGLSPVNTQRLAGWIKPDLQRIYKQRLNP